MSIIIDDPAHMQSVVCIVLEFGTDWWLVWCWSTNPILTDTSGLQDWCQSWS